MPQVGQATASISTVARAVRVWIGVDPGASGGLAAVDAEGGIYTAKMPGTDVDVLEWFRAWAMRQTPLLVPVAVLEKVGGYVGGDGQPGSAMFKFGAGYGALRMALCAVGIPYDEVQPSVWQRAVGVSSRKKGKRVKGKMVGGESKTQYKNRLKQRAQQLYPGVEVTLATCDALLIAHYCRMKDEGKL